MDFLVDSFCNLVKMDFINIVCVYLWERFLVLDFVKFNS